MLIAHITRDISFSFELCLEQLFQTGEWAALYHNREMKLLVDIALDSSAKLVNKKVATQLRGNLLS
jgi:hypothetical protein